MTHQLLAQAGFSHKRLTSQEVLRYFPPPTSPEERRLRVALTQRKQWGAQMCWILPEINVEKYCVLLVDYGYYTGLRGIA